MACRDTCANYNKPIKHKKDQPGISCMVCLDGSLFKAKAKGKAKSEKTEDKE